MWKFSAYGVLPIEQRNSGRMICNKSSVRVKVTINYSETDGTRTHSTLQVKEYKYLSSDACAYVTLWISNEKRSTSI